MSLAFAEHDVAVWQGDAREQLTLMPAGSVQCALSSPPYFGLRDYGTGRWEGGGGDCDHKPRKDPTRNIATSTLGGSKGTVGDQQKGYHGRCSRCGAHRVDEQLGLESSPAEYVARMVAVFAEVRRVLAADGVLWLNLGDSYYSGRGNPGPNSADEKQQARRGWVRALDRPGQDWGRPKNLLGMPWRVAFALQDDGWILRNAVVWHKPNAMPESVTDRLSTRYELVFLFSSRGGTGSTSTRSGRTGQKPRSTDTATPSKPTATLPARREPTRRRHDHQGERSWPQPGRRLEHPHQRISRRAFRLHATRPR
jgi:DNA modification methylase